MSSYKRQVKRLSNQAREALEQFERQVYPVLAEIRHAESFTGDSEQEKRFFNLYQEAARLTTEHKDPIFLRRYEVFAGTYRDMIAAKIDWSSRLDSILGGHKDLESIAQHEKNLAKKDEEKRHETLKEAE